MIYETVSVRALVKLNVVEYRDCVVRIYIFHWSVVVQATVCYDLQTLLS